MRKKKSGGLRLCTDRAENRPETAESACIYGHAVLIFILLILIAQRRTGFGSFFFRVLKTKGQRMTKRETYESRTEQLLQPMMEEHQFELVDVEYVKEGGTWYLRAYIDKPDGITINDCEVISRALSDKLDEEDFIEDSYVLEVSSPGLGRPLKKEKDFQRSIGEAVEIKLYKPQDGTKEYTGILKEFDKDTVTIEKEDGSCVVFSRDALALIRLAFDF